MLGEGGMSILSVNSVHKSSCGETVIQEARSNTSEEEAREGGGDWKFLDPEGKVASSLCGFKLGGLF